MTDPCFLAISVSLEEVEAFGALVIMTVHTVHGCLRGIFAGTKNLMLSEINAIAEYSLKTYSMSFEVTCLP